MPHDGAVDGATDGFSLASLDAAFRPYMRDDGTVEEDFLIRFLSSLGSAWPDGHAREIVASAKRGSPAQSPGRIRVDAFLQWVFAARCGGPPAQLGAILPACHFRILHVNDVYELDNLPILKSAVDALSRGLPPQNVLSTLAGDFLAPSLLSSLDHGHAMIDVLNRIPVKAVCFGNHESDVPYASLKHRIAQYKGHWLNSNMRNFEPHTPDNAVLELQGGRRVGLIGLNVGGGRHASLYRSGAFGNHAQEIVPVLEAVDGAVSRCHAAHPDLDAIVPLTHQDMPDDVKLAKRGMFPVILGGHDHGVFHEVHEGCAIVKGGEDAFNVVCIDLRWPEGAPRGAKPEVEVKFVPLARPKKAKGELVLDYAPDPSMAAIVHKWQEPVRELQSATLAKFPAGTLSSVGVRAAPSTMGAQLADALRDSSDADGALLNSGGVRGNKVYEDGTVTYADLSAECPFPSSNVVIKLTGRALRDAVAESRRPWTEGGGRGGNASADAFQVDLGMVMDASGSLCKVGGLALQPDALYDILVDSYMINVNPVLKVYAEEFPDRIPDKDAGRPVLPLLVEFFCDQAWKQIGEMEDGGCIDEAKVDALFDAFDSDNTGFLCEENVFQGVAARLPHMASRVVARQMLAVLDENSDGRIYRADLKRCLLEEEEEHMHLDHAATHNTLTRTNTRWDTLRAAYGSTK